MKKRSTPALGAALLTAAAAVAGCAVESLNTQPAHEIAQQSAPPGSVYAGWRVFQDKCAACHGPAATGSGLAPNLLLRVNELGPRQFVNLVLRRYDWSFSARDAASESAAREALIDDVLSRREPSMVMPAWQNEPRVNAHVMDLYAYLSQRAAGQLGPEPPAR